jgi:hypothetical protein
MEQLSTTLFDRLVTRAITPSSPVAASFDPVFETFGEEVAESEAPPALGPPSINRTESPAEFRRNSAPLALLQTTASALAKPERQPVPLPPQDRRVGETRIVNRIRVQYREAQPEAAAPPVPVESASPVEPFPQPGSPPVAEPDIPFEIPHVRFHVTSSEIRPPQQRSVPVVQPDLPVTIPESKHSELGVAPAPKESVIYVTIGRLEVRSGEREKPARRREPTLASESLEEYLAKRCGGAS